MMRHLHLLMTPTLHLDAARNVLLDQALWSCVRVEHVVLTLWPAHLHESTR